MNELVDMRPEIKKALSTLQPREVQVIKLRFGLCDGKPATLSQIGNRLDINRERVRQIEAEALRKIRCLNSGQTLLNRVF